MDYLASQSSDTVSAILSFLKVGSILNLGATSKVMRSVVADAVLWEDLSIRDFRINPHSFPRSPAGWLQLYKNMKAPVVLTWGDNGNGRLRQSSPSWEGVQVPTPIDTTDIGPIASIACTGWGMHALNQKGEVWFWGQLDDHTNQTTGARLPLPERCRSVSGGRSFGCALGDSGAAYSWIVGPQGHNMSAFGAVNPMGRYSSEFSVQVVPCTESSVQAKTIAAGWSHVALLLADGTIKTCLIDDIKTIGATSAFSIPLDANDRIEHLAAGCDFTVALSRRGRVFLWREIGKPPASATLQHDTDAELGLSGASFSHVSACLHNLSVVDATTGRLRTFNLNNSTETTSAWMDSTRDIAKIAHGDWHGGALLTNGQVWTWGNGSSALGLGRNDNRPVHEPEQIRQGLDGLFVFDIAFGGWHSAALAFRVDA